MTNRDRPATTLTKREKAAERFVSVLMTAPYHSHEEIAASAVALADALYDELDVPLELRDEDEDAWVVGPKIAEARHD